jgi:hypothetical protein
MQSGRIRNNGFLNAQLTGVLMTCACTAPALDTDTLKRLEFTFEYGLFKSWRQHLSELEMREDKAKHEAGWLSTSSVANELDKAYISHLKDIFYDLDATEAEQAIVREFEARYGSLSNISGIYSCDNCFRPTPGDGSCELVFCPECRWVVPILF